MRRNPYSRQRRLIQEIANRAAQTAAEAARGQSAPENSLSAAATDPGTGELLTVGLLDYTHFGDGFRLS